MTMVPFDYTQELVVYDTAPGIIWVAFLTSWRQQARLF
jgi:hypothetical protein